ncbi:hypothetical protein STAFG_5233 [Streptomyces afghaniensis 772]|uniref:Uncharacterized protein n=1 Tax=Streptomyces afghaniensis 772 TaxID=1283301 RepID=S4MVE1_9ACTN|nr:MULTISPECIES: hypothetical protein [Streptomyces]EPJ37712.1 hypothetical protein STAFG_5233 [Streptomyces afghaniensis 772]UOB15814.1 hypothetical protein MQE23_34330 [Streptomyces sp. HP-A2021]
MVCVLWVAVVAAFLVVGMFAEVVTAFSNTLERGDAEYYKARVDKAVAKRTARASAPVEPNKPRPPAECAIPLRAYRGVGGWYVAEVALAQGWELRPTDVRKEVRLWWSAASKVA